MQLVGALHAILELAVMLWQFFSDDVCASRNGQGGRKKHSLTDLELISRHNVPAPKQCKSSFEIAGYDFGLIASRALAPLIDAEALDV